MLGHLMHVYDALRKKYEAEVQAEQKLQKMRAAAGEATNEQELARKRELEKAEADITQRPKAEPAPTRAIQPNRAKKKSRFRLWAGPRIDPAPYGPFNTEGE